jgi:hypothetical protein
MVCRVCQSHYRKGFLVNVADKGTLTRIRVCPKCAAKAIPILPMEQGTNCNCGAPATICSKCVEKKEHKAKTGDVRGAIEGIRKLVKSYQVVAPLAGSEDFTEGRIEGLESAAGFLESGKW